MKLILIFVVWIAVGEGTVTEDDIKILYIGNSNTDIISFSKSNSTNSSSISTTYFNPSKKTVIITMGWKIRPTDEDPRTLINAYLPRKTEWNILYVDWYAYAAGMFGSDVVKNIKFVANITTKLLKDNTKFNASSSHLIGHGFGAVMFGLVARNSKTFDRFTVLDSENFFRSLLDIQYRLLKIETPKKGDANFVDTIHCNDGVLGDAKVVGDANFYPNAGKKQPGCQSIIEQVFNSFINQTFFWTLTCSHRRCASFYAESVGRNSSSPAFIVKACPSSAKNFDEKTCKTNTTVSMGYYAQATKAAGNYFVATNVNSTYSQS